MDEDDQFGIYADDEQRDPRGCLVLILLTIGFWVAVGAGTYFAGVWPW